MVFSPPIGFNTTRFVFQVFNFFAGVSAITHDLIFYLCFVITVFVPPLIIVNPKFWSCVSKLLNKHHLFNLLFSIRPFSFPLSTFHFWHQPYIYRKMLLNKYRLFGLLFVIRLFSSLFYRFSHVTKSTNILPIFSSHTFLPKSMKFPIFPSTLIFTLIFQPKGMNLSILPPLTSFYLKV